MIIKFSSGPIKELRFEIRNQNSCLKLQLQEKTAEQILK